MTRSNELRDNQHHDPRTEIASSAAEESLLGGCLVLDLTDQKGVLASRILGDIGAEVVKVEPLGGCSARTEPPFWKDAPVTEGSLFWFYTNLNKKSITLNIENQEGKSIFRRLVERAQFIVESFEPGYMDSIGLGYEQLKEINPSIVMTPRSLHLDRLALMLTTRRLT